MQLTDEQNGVLGASGNLLVVGGPGSGKTTISILKAVAITDSLARGQAVMFLSFARASVGRVAEAMEYEQRIPKLVRDRIEVETYHSFMWRILRNHGYLIGLPRRLSLLAPQAEAIALSVKRAAFASRSRLSPERRSELGVIVAAEQQRLAFEDGRVCFALFAELSAHLLQASRRLRSVVSLAYPTIILDEFQDTNSAQWDFVKALGEGSCLIALADPEQRIYDWIGADPKRLDHLRDAFKPREFDLTGHSHRSVGTDIAAFGNDVLTGHFRSGAYEGIDVKTFAGNQNAALTCLITTVYRVRERVCAERKRDWSVGVLTPTKKLTRAVSDVFRSPLAGMHPISHEAAVDRDAAILAAEVVGHMLEPEVGNHLAKCVGLLADYFDGRGGDTPSLGHMKEAAGLRSALDEWQERRLAGKPIRANSVLVNFLSVYGECRLLNLTGDPEFDWRAMLEVLRSGPCSRLQSVADDARNLRLLNRGTVLRSELSEAWRRCGSYLGALPIVRQAFAQEHFATAGKPERGVVVMNMHKAKGKQFDEVVLFEGWPLMKRRAIIANLNRIVQDNIFANASVQARQTFRVGVTRAKRRTTILTPENDPCVLLLPPEES